MNNPSAPDTVYVPVSYDRQYENQPLLNRQPQQQPNHGCTRGVLCKRCLAGTHKNTPGRSFLRRLIAVLSLLWFVWVVKHWVLDHSVWSDNHCFHHLVAWNGPSTISSNSADSIEVAFGKGDITSSVEVLTREDVVKPTVFVDAWVTKNYPEEEDVKERERVVKGLEVEITESDGKLTIVFSSEDNTGRRGPHWPHNRKFCAKVDIKVVFPSTLRSYNRLIIGGALLDLDVRGISKIAFESIHLRTTVGSVVGVDDVKAKSLDVASVTGSIKIGSIKPVEGHGLSVMLESTVGSIRVNATTNPILSSDKTPEELRHNLIIKSNTGSVEAVVRPGSGYDYAVQQKKGSVIGDVYVNALSLVGHVATDVVLAPGQVLHQELSANMGSVKSTVSDSFLGSIDVRTDYGGASVTEAPASASIIQYEENTRTVKVGHKVLLNDGRGGSEERKGVMNLQTQYGGASLNFV